MRTLLLPLLVLAVACGSPPAPVDAAEAGRWTGSYRYGGTRTELRQEGRFFRFSDARLGRFAFRLTSGGFLEDDTTGRPVRVFPDVRDDAAGGARPFRSLRLTNGDEHLILLRVS